MILVDDGGGKWPAINHSPWNGVTLADFVMPFFLFIVGLSISFSYKRIPSKADATSKAIQRSLKLVFLGIILQGGYYHGLDDLSFGVDVIRIRWCGILQRIAFAYFVVSICEIWNPRRLGNTPPHVPLAVFNMYFWHWVVAGLLSTLYLIILYGVYVPDWEFVPASSQSVSPLKVTCGVRGDLSPPCNAVGFVDRLLLGLNHMYGAPMYRRTKDCSINSPDYGPAPPGAPTWCRAPFEPEGLLSSVSAVGSCFIGLHYGHILVHLKSHDTRMKHWMIPSLGLIVFGMTLHYLGVPLNKPIYSFSYVCVTAGTAGLVFVAIYLIADVCGVTWPTKLLEWMGQNSLIIFVLAACGVFAGLIQGFYWKEPEYNLVNFVEEHVFQALFTSERVAKLVFVLFEIILWCLVAGALKAKGMFWKL
ncbi:hypothetical protein Mapa_013595 [Marchantia paleacea]|nr:hypothetical protein Mapa_013595 [Marchantia paleacea]